MPSYIKGPELEKYSPGIAALSIGHPSCPSWQVNRDGFATLKATRPAVTPCKWVSLTVTETTAEGRARQVMLTLTEREAAALAHFLTGEAAKFPVSKFV